MVPLSIALIQRFFGVHERLGLWRILGLGLGFVGVAALLGFGTISGPLGWAGVGCMLIATLSYAIGPLTSLVENAGAEPALTRRAYLLVKYATFAFAIVAVGGMDGRGPLVTKLSRFIPEMNYPPLTMTIC